MGFRKIPLWVNWVRIKGLDNLSTWLIYEVESDPQCPETSYINQVSINPEDVGFYPVLCHKNVIIAALCVDFFYFKKFNELADVMVRSFSLCIKTGRQIVLQLQFMYSRMSNL